MAGAIGVKGGANAAWNTEGFALFRSGQPCAVVSQKIATVERREASGPIARPAGAFAQRPVPRAVSALRSLTL